MVRTIRVLDHGTVNKIAAGEVVESPSSVVKELMENSLDAGARELEVHIDGGGIKRVQVADDGCGMGEEDASLAFTRHSTSKISTIDDLDRLSSLGFRGEALASIAAVARVELITSTGNEDGGRRVVVKAGEMVLTEDVGCPKGTKVTVSDLFENVPARKRFLKSERSERSRCMDVVNRMILCHPEVGIRLLVDGEERINDRGSSDRRKRAAAVFGVKTARSMVEVPDLDMGLITLGGLISLPWETRSNSAGITLSVSGRVVRNRSIVEALRRGYGSRLMKGRFPLAVLMIDVDPSRLDVNVHPTKDIVKFEDEGSLLGIVERAVGKCLFAGGKVDRLKGAPSKHEPYQKMERPRTSQGSFGVKRRKPQSVLFEGEVRVQGYPEQDVWSGIPTIEGVQKLPPALPEDTSGLRMTVIGQLDRSYILCELGSDLLLVDQHAAHERIRLESFKNRYEKKGYSTQELLEPINIELDPVSYERARSLSRELSDMGFDLEDFGNDQVTIRGVPQFLGRTEAHEVIKDLVTGNEYHDGCSPPDPEFQPRELGLKDRILALSACRGAIKAHDQLSLIEMERLVSDLLKCEIPLHCAHGRPTMIRLPLSALERWFRRVI